MLIHTDQILSLYLEFKIITLPSLFILNALMFIWLNFNAIACAQLYNSYNTRKKGRFSIHKIPPNTCRKPTNVHEEKNVN